MTRLRPLCSLALLTTLVSGCSADAPRGEPLGEAPEAQVVCGGPSVLTGIDVSSWQATIDWSKVAGAGHAYAVARISDGTYLDADFAANWQGIHAAGLVRGAYQFFEPGTDVGTQADIVINAVGQLGPGDLPVTIDLE